MRSEVPRKCENPILKGKERNRQGEIGNNLDHDFAESSTAILNAPNSAVSWIFSLPPVESRCLGPKSCQSDSDAGCRSAKGKGMNKNAEAK